jgi:K+-sensing histidine kinase KdpD
VNLQHGGPGVLLQVEDEGIGLSPGTAETISGLFERASNALKIPGQGLGLYICRRSFDSRAAGSGRAAMVKTAAPRFTYGCLALQPTTIYE